jgi:hypothetical protein
MFDEAQSLAPGACAPPLGWDVCLSTQFSGDNTTS